jgi:hypothetical protein
MRGSRASCKPMSQKRDMGHQMWAARREFSWWGAEEGRLVVSPAASLLPSAER